MIMNHYFGDEEAAAKVCMRVWFAKHFLLSNIHNSNTTALALPAELAYFEVM